MKTAQIAVLGLAVVAAGGAGLIAMNLTAPPAQVQTDAGPVVQQTTMEQVLVASADIAMGTEITTQVAWIEWPANATQDGFIKQSAEPTALEDISGSIARSPILTGEPIRRAKLIGAGQSFMSSILPAGKRAIATQITADTAAGGFILPNDFVDVIMTRRIAATADAPERFTTDTVLKNIRVLAIDQNIQEDEDGRRVKVGETATLELTPEQAENLTVVQQMADRLTLALRSIADANEEIDQSKTSSLGGGDSGAIRLIKQGVVTETQGAKK
jgi:pilus assembly protein CpaB